MSTRRVSVCEVNDLGNGQMQQFSVAGRDILLARVENDFFAVAAHCSHYGAPLEKGVLSDGRVVCPWHNACFNLSSGAMLEPPGRNNLAQYPTSIESGNVYVEVAESEVQTQANTFVEVPPARKAHVAPDFAQPDFQKDDRTFVIVGGGAAGSAAAEYLRQIGYQGHIVMLTADNELPYDRTALSKAYLQSDSADDPDLLRSADFYQQHGIEVKTSARVTKMNAESQQLTYGSGDVIRYDALLLATGGKARQLPIEGIDLENVFTLRRAEGAKEILKAVQHVQRVVVVGAGFIGMEVAASLRQQGLDVTVVAPNSVPFEKVLGKSVGQMFQQVHESQGVQFKLETKATALHGKNRVESVELATGETIPADLVVIGVGIEPATDFTEGLTLDDSDRSIVVDEYLQAAPNIYAAGDIARFPDSMTGESVRIEHWRLALQHGRIAACNMAGKEVPFKSIPFFWTGQFDIKLRYVGHAENWDDVIIHGSLEEQSFLAFYIQADKIRAVAGVGRDRDIAAISELMRLKQMPTASEVRQVDLDWNKHLSGINP